MKKRPVMAWFTNSGPHSGPYGLHLPRETPAGWSRRAGEGHSRGSHEDAATISMVLSAAKRLTAHLRILTMDWPTHAV